MRAGVFLQNTDPMLLMDCGVPGGYLVRICAPCVLFALWGAGVTSGRYCGMDLSQWTAALLVRRVGRSPLG